jgi:hypothetical protein
MILQLNPPIPIETPRGPGLAVGWIDYGPDHDLLWICLLSNRECWTYGNRDIRAVTNETLGRQ